MNKKTLVIVLVGIFFAAWVAFVIYNMQNEFRSLPNPRIPSGVVTPTPQEQSPRDYPKPNRGTTYTCPASDYIDCMPQVGGPKNSMCSPEYVNWAKQNCPNFRGIAY